VRLAADLRGNQLLEVALRIRIISDWRIFSPIVSDGRHGMLALVPSLSLTVTMMNVAGMGGGLAAFGLSLALPSLSLDLPSLGSRRSSLSRRPSARWSGPSLGASRRLSP
jgi:hypothetical protein